MTDVELQALTALVNAETTRQHVQIETGGKLLYAPDYRAEQALQVELERRGIVPAESTTTPVEDDDIPYWSSEQSLRRIPDEQAT